MAREILKEAAEELALSAVTVIRRLGMERDRFPVAAVGGVFAGGPLVLGPLGERIAAAAPHAVLGPPAYPPELGAVRLLLATE